jgi:hypothetical protein
MMKIFQKNTKQTLGGTKRILNEKRKTKLAY